MLDAKVVNYMVYVYICIWFMLHVYLHFLHNNDEFRIATIRIQLQDAMIPSHIYRSFMYSFITSL
jgi:hypothetical protein